MATIPIPTGFLDDHEDRGLPTPRVVRRTRGRAWIDTEDPALPELLSDARYYADPAGPDSPGLRRAARALLRAVERAGKVNGARAG